MVHGLRRGEIYLADLRDLVGSEARGSPFRPLLVVQSDALRYGTTVLAVPLTTSRTRALAPGAVSVPRDDRNHLAEDSVATSHPLLAVDRSRLRERIGVVQPATVERVAAAVATLVEAP